MKSKVAKASVALVSAPLPAPVSRLLRGELIEPNRVPAVVCLEEVQELLAKLSSSRASQPGTVSELWNKTAEYVERYFIAEAENRRALSSVLSSLAGDEGRGFILNGLYGSGKSHFLAVVGLLAGCSGAWPLFLRTHPEYAALARRFLSGGATSAASFEAAAEPANHLPAEDANAPTHPLLVIMAPLDSHRGSTEDLEDIIFGEAERALSRLPGGEGSRLSAASFALHLAEERLFPLYQDAFAFWLTERIGAGVCWEELRLSDPGAAAGLVAEFARAAGAPMEWHEPRRERLHRMLEWAQKCGCRGVVLLLDELSLFLSSKSRDRFHNDVSFLQFMGQMSRFYPLWTVAALQRGMEEVGDIDADTLHKLKDRYVWDLTLSMAQIRQVIGQKLVRQKDPIQFHSFVETLWRERAAVGLAPGLDPEELAEIYPFHPVALECLIEASSRFFSKTRSVIQFTLRMVEEGREEPASDLVGPDRVFDHFWLAVMENPELRPTQEACAYYEREIGVIYPQDPAYALRLVRGLAALSLAGIRKTVRELVSAMPPQDSSPLSSTALAHSILETLRRSGGYVDVSRGEDDLLDVYFFDAGYDIVRAVRRRLASCAADLDEEDGRIGSFALLAASDASLPLATLATPLRVEVEWLTVRYTALVRSLDLTGWTGAMAQQELAWLGDSTQPESLCLLVAPLADPTVQRDRWGAVAQAMPEDRWRSALVAWLPRPLRPDERRVLREYGAYCLLLEDPTLRTHGLGRQVLARLRGDRAGRDLEARSIVRSAYAEGELLGMGHPIADGRDLKAHAGRLEEVVALAASRSFPDLFPDMVQVAPRRRVSGKGALVTLLNEFVLPGSAPIRPGDPLDALIRDLALPLGIAAVGEGRYVLCDPPEALMDLVRCALPEDSEASWKETAGSLAKSRYGLGRDAVDLLLAALVRRGHLVACDAAGLPMPLAPASLPLSAHARKLRRGDVLAAETWARLESLAAALEVPFTERTVEEQERLWERLQALRLSGAATLLEEQLAALLEELSGAAGSHSPPDLESHGVEQGWEGSFGAIRDWDACLGAVVEEASAVAGLRFFLERLPEGLESALPHLYRSWRALERFVAEEGPQLARALRMLNNPLCVLPAGGELDVRRGRLARAVGEGEAVVPRAAEAVRYALSILERYRSDYVQWHTATFGEAQYAPYRRVMASPAWALLEQLERLPIPNEPVLGGLQGTVEEQLFRQCSSAGLAGALLRGAVCPSCRLPLGSAVDMVPVREIESALEKGISERWALLAAPERLEKLRQHRDRRLTADSPIYVAFGNLLVLLEVLKPDAEADWTELRSWLNDALVREIRSALLAGEPAARSLGTLEKALRGREIARQDAVRLFTGWLDPEGKLGPEEFVRIEG